MSSQIKDTATKVDQAIDNASNDLGEIQAKMETLLSNENSQPNNEGQQEQKKKKRRAKKKKKNAPEGQKKCTFCQKLLDEADGKVKNDQFYCIPCARKVKCPQCSQWFDEESGKIDDQEGVWFCFKCWSKWERTQDKFWTQRDPERYMSSKMKKIEKNWAKGGGW